MEERRNNVTARIVLPLSPVPEVYKLGKGATNINTNARMPQPGHSAWGGHWRSGERIEIPAFQDTNQEYLYLAPNCIFFFEV